MTKKYVEELSELRTCSSIIGLACGRIVKHFMRATDDADIIRYVTILDSTLTKLEEHIKALEKLMEGDVGDGTANSRKAR